MIIAWGLFIISVFCSFIYSLGILFKEMRGKRDGANFLIYFIIALCSAQYIWG